MPFSLIGSVSADGTTAALDTRGADLLVAVVGADAPSITDSLGNTWTALTQRSWAGDGFMRVYYCRGGTVGASHTFSPGAGYRAICVLAFSGSASSSVFDAEVGGIGTTGLATGSITPSQNDCLVIAGWGFGGNANTFSLSGSGFTLAQTNTAVSGSTYGAALAYQIQTTATAVNPSMTWSGGGSGGATAAVFKAAGGGSTSGSLSRTNANDTSSGAGTQTNVGTLARSNAADTSAASGAQTNTGSLARANANDTSAASGGLGTAGSLARTNSNDAAAGVGITTPTGQVARVNANDTATATGAAGSITGTVDALNRNDSANAQGVGPAQTLGGVGKIFPQPRRKRETEEEKLVRRIAQGIVQLVKEEEPKPAPVEVQDDKQARSIERRTLRLKQENEQIKARIEQITAQAQEAELQRLALKVIQDEENDIAFVMSVLAHA